MDDDDAFLYGDDPQPEPAPAPVQTKETSEPAALVEQAAEDASGHGSDDSDDSDIEFIIDPNAPAVPPSRSVAYVPPPAAQKAALSDAADAVPTPLEPTVPAQEAYTIPNVPGPAAEPLVETMPVAPAAAVPTLSTGSGLPEGPAPPALSTAPALALEPATSALQYPPAEPVYDARTEQEKATQPPPLTIYQVDIDSLPEKPWRRPGANQSDYFNYGFDETTWAMWCAQKNRMEQTRAGFATLLQDGEEAEAPYVPTDAAPDAPPVLPGMPGMLPPGMMGMPGMPWSTPDGMPMMGIPPAPAAPTERNAPEDFPESNHRHGDRGDRGPREARHGGRGTSSRRGGRSQRPNERSPQRDERNDDVYAPEDHPTASHGTYQGREGPDYGASRPEEDRRRRRSPEPHQDGRGGYDEGHRIQGRDRHSRRDRNRSDRRAGRGPPKRGAPDGGDDGGDYAAKRFHSHR